MESAERQKHVTTTRAHLPGDAGCVGQREGPGAIQRDALLLAVLEEAQARGLQLMRRVAQAWCAKLPASGVCAGSAQAVNRAAVAAHLQDAHTAVKAAAEDVAGQALQPSKLLGVVLGVGQEAQRGRGAQRHLRLAQNRAQASNPVDSENQENKGLQPFCWLHCKQ